MSWAWDTANPLERSDFVRSHDRLSQPLSDAALCDLFSLTREGLAEIRKGNPWRYDYERHTPSKS